jgi:hypothetical protein
MEFTEYVGDRPAAAFDGLRFVQDHVLPLDPLEVLDVLDDELVAGDDNVEGCFLRMETLLVPELPQDAPVLCVPPIRHNLLKHKTPHQNRYTYTQYGTIYSNKKHLIEIDALILL